MIIGNTFLNNNGLKGVVIVDKDNNINSSIIGNNNFINSSAVMESNVMNLRSKTSNVKLLASSFPLDESYYSCGGFKLINNNF